MFVVMGRRVLMAQALLVSLPVLASCSAVLAADWPHWRGPNRNDITSEASGWDQGAWPLGEPAWRKSVGHGATSPIIVGDRLFTMGWQNGRDSVYCLDAATGEQIWRQEYTCPKYGRHHAGDENWYHGPSSTPAYDRDSGFLYTLSIDGDLNCWYARGDGGRFWGINLYDEYGVKQRPDVGGGIRDYGYTTSPLIRDDWLIVEVGDEEGNLMAFGKLTGRRLWTSECKDPYDWQTRFANNIPTPAVLGDQVILSSGYNMSRTARIRVTLGGATEVWQSRYFTQVCSPVIYNGHVYMAWQKLRCLDYETGELSWEGGRFSNDASCLVTGDGRLIVFGNRTVALAETADRSPDAYTELSIRAKIGSSHSWPHVALANGRLYVKDRDGNLYCFTLGG